MNVPTHITVQVYTALVNARTDLKDSLEAQGGCDHSVGICQCGQQRTLDEVERAIANIEPYAR